MKKNAAYLFIAIFSEFAYSDQLLMPSKGFAFEEWNIFNIVLSRPCSERIKDKDPEFVKDGPCQIVISKYQSHAGEIITDIVGKSGDTIMVRYKMDKDPKNFESIAHPFGIVMLTEPFNAISTYRTSSKVKFYSER